MSCSRRRPSKLYTVPDTFTETMVIASVDFDIGLTLKRDVQFSVAFSHSWEDEMGVSVEVKPEVQHERDGVQSHATRVEGDRHVWGA